MSIWLRSLWRGFPFLRASHVRTMRRCRWVRATPLSISTSFNAHFRYPQLPSRPRLNTGVVLQLSRYWSFYGWSLPSGLCQARDDVIIRNSRSKQSLQSPYTSSRSHSRPIRFYGRRLPTTIPARIRREKVFHAVTITFPRLRALNAV